MKNLKKLSEWNFIVYIRAGEPVSEPGVFGYLEPEPLEKKARSRSRMEKKSGVGAAKKLAGSCWRIKSLRKLYFCYSSLGK